MQPQFLLGTAALRRPGATAPAGQHRWRPCATTRWWAYWPALRASSETAFSSEAPPSSPSFAEIIDYSLKGVRTPIRCLAVGELLADALAVRIGQSQPLVVQGRARRTTDQADSQGGRAEEEERRSDPGALAGAPGAGLLLLQLSGRVDRQNPDGVGGGEPGVRASAHAASGPGGHIRPGAPLLRLSVSSAERSLM
jgi:hypothetical protein